MAILQSALVEPLISRRHAAILREIVHASQLNEAVVMLDKMQLANTINGNKAKSIITSYLQSQMLEILTNVKIPASVQEEPTKVKNKSPSGKTS